MLENRNTVWFRADNTEGFSVAQLDEMNDRMAAETRYIPEWDTDTLDEIRKQIADRFTNQS